MTKSSTVSSSSTNTVISKDFQEIARLGEMIVESLPPRDRDAPDLLTRWICHEVAEAMKTVKKAKSARARNQAVRAATDLILLLWEHRSSWPDGWPPPAVRAHLAQLETPTTRWDPEPEPSGSPWFDAIRDFDSLQRSELRLVLQMGLLESGVETERAILAALPTSTTDGSEEIADVATLKFYVEHHDAGKQWAAQRGATTNEEIRELAKDEFRKLNADRRKLNRRIFQSPVPESRE